VTGEQPKPESITGVPYISPVSIEALRLQPFNFEEAYSKLQEENPDLARELLLAAERYASKNTEIKRAFARGALFLYLQFANSTESAQLDTLLETSSDGGDDDAGRPLST
jgi:hypothetical protein